MKRIEKTVFLSYRRTNFFLALAIYQDLTQHGYDVFFDYTGINSGAFESVILENIQASAHFLVLLTPSALERCSDLADVMRREIEAALDCRRNVVPLLVEGFDFCTPTIAKQLTGRLAILKQYNALSISPHYFFDAMKKLRDRFLNVPLDAVLQPPSLVAQQAAAEQKGAAATAPAVPETELTAQQWFERGFDAADLDEQLRFYSLAISLKPDYAEAFCNRSWSRSERGDLDGALEDVDEAIRLKPDLANAIAGRGIFRQKRGDLNRALQDFDEAIRLKPDLQEVFNWRGNTRHVKGDLEGALTDFTEAIRLKPDDALGFYNRGNARSSKGDPEGALQDYDEAIRLKPDYAQAFNNRGAVRRLKGDSDGAMQDLDEAIRLKPDLVEALYNRSNAHAEKGDLEGALQDYDEAMRIKPAPKIWCLRTGDQDPLHDHFVSIRLKHFIVEALINRGKSLVLKGDTEGTLHDLNEAIRCLRI